MSYTIKSGDTLSRIAKRNNLTLIALLAANPRYKADPNLINVGDVLVIPGKKPSVIAKKAPVKKKPVAKKAAPATAPDISTDDPFIVPYGQLTFDAEGMEKPGPFFSRVAHVPSNSSGITIGRGYDLSERSKNEIIADMREAGISLKLAQQFAQGRGLRGARARQFIKSSGLAGVEITPQQQKALFLLTYKELEGDVIRICNKADVVQKYGGLTWDAVNPTIRDVLVDLRYRGDYTGATREVVQPPTVKDSLPAFTKALINKNYWVEQRGVPPDRFKRRCQFLEQA